MTEPEAPTDDEAPASAARSSGRVPRRRARWPIVLVAIPLVLALLLAALYLNRRAAAKQVLTGWLDRQGIDADVSVERLEMDGFVGRIRIGDPADPDVTVERVEVDYALGMPWSQTGMGVVPGRIRLVRPVLRATWADGELSLGSLDPLVERFTGRPPAPDTTSPVVIVEQGRLNLGTDYGPLVVEADARIEDGKLLRLSAVLPSATLRGRDLSAQALAGRLTLTTTGDRVAVSMTATADRFGIGAATGETTRMSVEAALPYPDLETRRGDGRAVVDLTLTSDRLASGQTRASDVVVRVGFDGQATGWIETLALRGRAGGSISTSRLDGSGLAATGLVATVDESALDLARTDTGVRWALEGPAAVRAGLASTGDLTLTQATVRSGRLVAGGRDGAFEVSGPMALTAGRIAFGDLSLRQATGQVDLDWVQDGLTRITANGALRSTGGAWPLFGAIAVDDVPELAEMKRALGNFALNVPAFRLSVGSTGTEVILTAPARLTPANGGVLKVNPVASPIYAARSGTLGGGALAVTATRGAGLPQATVAVPDWRLTPGGFEARLDAAAALDFGIARGLTVRTSGLLASDRGRLTYVAADCLTFTAERLELDENDANDLSGRLCPAGRPLVEVRQGAWRADGTLADVAALAPFLAVGINQAQGTLTVTGSPVGLGLEARIASARVRDTTVPRRFNPLTASGSAALAANRWTGAFDLSSGPYRVAQVALNHDGLSGVGGVSFDTGELIFAEDALQPDLLTPLVEEVVQSPVTGQIGFTGRFDWSEALPEGGTSSGRLTVPGLDFVSPAGPVKGLKGTIDFTSLAPLTTAPGQSLKVDRLESVAPFTDLDVTFELDKAALSVAGGEIRAAGGTVRVEPFSVPLNGTDPFGGVIVLDRVQLGDLLAGSGFGDKVMLDAVVSGRLPFTYSPTEGVRITAGSLAAVQPGRLSIEREALTGLEAGGGGGVPPGTVEDLAYQAMEDLAFNTLSAEVNSLDAGRLSVLFHVVGRHDPPERQELRLTLAELISREFLNRPLPLPSDTGIDLTLDTTLNLNQLVSDLLAVNRARNGEAAAPVAVTPVEIAPDRPSPRE